MSDETAPQMTHGPHPFHIVGECQECCDSSEALRLGYPDNVPADCVTPGCVNAAHVSSRPALTRRQQQVLDFIRLHVAYEGYPPSHRDIGDACGMTSISSVAYVLDRLQAFGYIRKDPSRPRAIVVLDVVE